MRDEFPFPLAYHFHFTAIKINGSKPAGPRPRPHLLAPEEICVGGAKRDREQTFFPPSGRLMTSLQFERYNYNATAKQLDCTWHVNRLDRGANSQVMNWQKACNLSVESVCFALISLAFFLPNAQNAQMLAA